MKQIFTLLVLVGFSAYSNAQVTQRTPADPAEAFEKDPSVYNQSRDRDNNAEAMVILRTVRGQVNSRVQQGDKTSMPPTMTVEEYQTLITNADNFLVAKKYEQAALLYKEVADNRSDQYSKDKLIQIEALQARQAKIDSIAKMDALVRAKAEFDHFKHRINQVHFTGGIMSDEQGVFGFSRAFEDDEYSNFLSYGKYNSLSVVLPKADKQTFDGIAVPAHTRLVIYKETDCKGEVLLDVTGPAIVNNTIWQTYDYYNIVNTKEYTPDLQLFFPQEVRSWSKSNMHYWNTGSLEIIYVAE